MNPRHLGIDENFLNTEMQTSKTELLVECIEEYEEILERLESDWHEKLNDTFQSIINIVNTKILYLIYRQVKYVYARR